MRGLAIIRVYVIMCEVCNENIIERADEGNIQTYQDALDLAADHRDLHVQDGSWPYEVRRRP